MSPTPDIIREGRKTFESVARPNNFAAFVAVVSLLGVALLVFAQWRYTEKMMERMDRNNALMDINNHLLGQLSEAMTEHETNTEERYRALLVHSGNGTRNVVAK